MAVDRKKYGMSLYSIVASHSIASATEPNPDPKMIPTHGRPPHRPRMHLADSLIRAKSEVTSIYHKGHKITKAEGLE
jgi:hypothetical protein